MPNFGTQKEDQMVLELNNKHVFELTNNLQYLVNYLYPHIDRNAFVNCQLVNDDMMKSDFIITVNNESKAISMKSGKAVVVHNEIFANFIDFLKEEGISDRTIETISLFQYGDGTTDGTGTQRLSFMEVMSKLGNRISEANDELNWSRDFIKKVVQRCVFKGARESNIEADALYFGDKDYGVVAFQSQFMRHLDKKHYGYYRNLHIGPLLIRPSARYKDKEIVDERRRNRIILYWPYLSDDVAQISRRYNY